MNIEIFKKYSGLVAVPHLWMSAILLILSCGSAAGEAKNEALGKYQIGLSMYSLRQLFKSGDLHAYEYPSFAQEQFGISLIDVWDGGFPDGWQENADFLPELKRRADAAGSKIFLVMTGTVDATPKESESLIRNGLEYCHAVDQAVVLGADYVRVFLRIAKQAPEEESIRRAVIALGALADYAETKGITVVVEPSPRTPLGSYLASLMSALDHSHCRLMPDFGKMKGTDIYQGTEDMMPFTAVVSAKVHEFAEDGSVAEFDYPRLMKIIREAGFDGIVAIEYEGRKLGPIEGVNRTVGILESLNR